MASVTPKISYKTALTATLPHTEPVSNLNPNASEFKPHTYWDDCPSYITEQTPDEYSNQWQREQYDALQRLKNSPTFQKKFATFAENALCITDTNTVKGCHANLEPSMCWYDENVGIQNKGKKMKNIGFWFIYRQDGFSYNVVYECDDINDPRTGWFYQWEHRKDCEGFSCDYFGCHSNYPPMRE